MTVDGITFVLLNPTHSETRRSPTLAEELVHIALGHPPSKLTVVGGVATRTCQHDVESEAYAVAVALLVPYRSLFNHLNGGGLLGDLPTPVPLSLECLLYRVKTAGLWRLYKARSAAGASGVALSNARGA
jgi:Zn-dependent peptidase ImmA (M78 family)